MRAVVTGGGGFLGGAVVRALLARGDSVCSVSRSAYPQLEAAGVDCVRADLAGPLAPLASAFTGADVVFHCAAKAGVWGPRAEFEHANVQGTERVLEACREAGVQRLVFTSSPSVCFDGRDHLMAGNDLPRATEFLAAYPATKARAEELVLAAHSQALATVALRPHLIFGPGDPHILPRIVERARSGKLRIVGDGGNEVSITYVDNAAAAHLAAAEVLGPGAACGGRAYFVGQREPVRLWDWINRILGAIGAPTVARRIPRGAASAAGALCETTWRVLRLSGEPPMTRFVAAQLATSHSYDMAPTEHDLGYIESVDLETATHRTIDWLRTAGR